MPSAPTCWGPSTNRRSTGSGEERDRAPSGVIPADEVTTDEGTGLVHMALAYGEADFVALQAAGLDVLVDPVDAEGRFTDAIPPLAGTRVKDADVELIERLKAAGLLYRRGQIRHSYTILLSNRDPADLQGDSHLVCPSRGLPRPNGRGQPQDPRCGACRCPALWQLARGRPRLGDKPQPLLGKLHPGVAMRPGRPTGYVLGR